MSLKHDPIPSLSGRPFTPVVPHISILTPEARITVPNARCGWKKIPYGEYADHDARLLCPYERSLGSPTLHLPCLEMMAGRTFPWADCRFRSGMQKNPRQLEWTQHILICESDTLRRAGIYEAVYLSLFDYQLDTSVLQAFVERWNYATNTLFAGDREMTMTLWELRQLSGLPISGSPYDEFIPREEDLSGLPGPLRRVFRQYHRICDDRGAVTWRAWISHFAALVDEPSRQFADLDDPLGVGRLEIFHEAPIHLRGSLDAGGLDRETALTAFLSWWLGYFILPAQPMGKIRPSTFVAAYRLAQGERLALAIPALASIYRGLRVWSSSRDPSSYREVIPYHFVCGWIHMHWSNVYTPALSESLRDRLPLLGAIAGAVPAHPSLTAARAHFALVEGHFRDSHLRLASRSSTSGEDTLIVDMPREPIRLDDYEFLISLRCALLPLRVWGSSDGLVALEPYFPHRCAHQFGFDQVLPSPVSFPEDLSADLPGLARCWSSILRKGTGTIYLIPGISRKSHFSGAYRTWYCRTTTSLSLPVAEFTRQLALGAKLAATRKRKRNEPSTLTDFQGRDSRYQHARLSGPPSRPPTAAGTFSFYSFLSPFVCFAL